MAFTPATSRSSGTPEKLIRAWFASGRSEKNGAPGTTITPERGMSTSRWNAVRSSLSGNVTHVNSPPRVRVHVIPGGKCSAIVASIRSRLCR